MNNVLNKYYMLNSFEKKEVSDYIDFLFSRKQHSGKPKLSGYKSKIAIVSVWNDDDVKLMDENSKRLSQWQPPTW